MNENENKNAEMKNKKSLKVFFIKLISISVAVVIIINLIFNLLIGERLEKIDKVLLLNKSQFRIEMKEKIRSELNDGLNKENMISEDDKILLYKIYLKLLREFENLDKSKI